MNDVSRSRYLPIAMIVFGLVFLFGLYPLTVYWPSGWAWHEHGRSQYLEMIMSLYATLGICLMIGSRHPDRHVSLIGFTIWSSIAHGAVMTFQALEDPAHVGHLYGDVPALFIAAVVFGWLCPRALKLQG